MTDDTQPEAMDLADWLEAVGGGPSAKRCAALLREQHARIAELESELEAVGAGGVSGPLMGRASPPTAQAEGWVSVEERLPPVRTTVFIARGSGPSAWRTLAFYDPDRYTPAWRCEDDPSEGIRGVSHWMHMPLPPTSAEGVEHG